VRLVGKRLKAWNRNVYYVSKYTILAGLLGGILITAF
jgi:aspartyl/asparaginyl beta-hydroxylase (cupin superfamily)